MSLFSSLFCFLSRVSCGSVNTHSQFSYQLCQHNVCRGCEDRLKHHLFELFFILAACLWITLRVPAVCTLQRWTPANVDSSLARRDGYELVVHQQCARRRAWDRIVVLSQVDDTSIHHAGLVAGSALFANSRPSPAVSWCQRCLRTGLVYRSIVRLWPSLVRSTSYYL